MNAKKVLIGPSSFANSDSGPMDMLISAGFDVIDNPYKRKLTKMELMALLSEDVVGLIAGLETLDREVMEKSKLKVISRVGSGVSNVDLNAAKELGIEVRSTPDGPTEAVAELTLGAMLSLMRAIPQMDCALHNGEWVKKTGFELKDKTVLLIGYGRIGKRVAELLEPFGVNIVVADPALKSSGVSKHKVLPMDDALPSADIISLHCNGEKCILDSNEFSRMKKGVFLLNVARGALVSEGALLTALDEGKVAGAWLDTFENEPYSGPLCKYSNVVLTPHVGSYTHECRKKMETDAVNNLLMSF